MSKRTNYQQDQDALDAIMEALAFEVNDFSLILSYVQSEYLPEDVYDSGELDKWALANGYVKEV